MLSGCMKIFLKQSSLTCGQFDLVTFVNSPATSEAFEKLRKQFEFNITASMHFDTQLNSSQSLQEMSQRIMEEISEEIGLFQRISGLLSYLSLFLLAYIYIQ